MLDHAVRVIADRSGNVHVVGFFRNNAFEVTLDGVITEIIDLTGDGARNNLSGPVRIHVDSAGNVYVAGFLSSNAFKIRP